MGLKNTYQAKKRFVKTPVSNTGMWYQNDPVVVPSNKITMKGPNGESDYFDSPIMGIGMQSGQKQIMQPGREYFFPNDNSVYERKMQNGAEVALDVTSMIPGPVGMTASGLGLAYDLHQGDWLGAGLNTANILTGGAAKGFMAAARVANNAGTRNLARGLASSSHNLNRASKIGNSFTQPVDRARTILNSNPYQQTQFGGYQDNTRLAPIIKPRMQDGGWLKSYQDAGEVSTEQNPEPIGQVHVRAKDKGWFDNYIQRPLRKFGRSYAQRISDATGGSEWYKQPNPFMNLAFESINAPQYAATYAVTGKVQTPSEAMNIQNPYGAFAVDAVLDPTNLLGAGLLKQPIKNIYKRNPTSISNLGEADRSITDLLDIFGIPDRVANIKSIGKELKGEIIKGGKNRKAIEEGNAWLKNWIDDPVTQNKIENDLAWASQRNDQYGLGYQQAKSFTPISKEYPFSQQLKDLFSGNTHMHSGNTGVSYLHRKDPYERLMPETLNDPKMGSFISRIPSRSSAQRRSTTIHEGTHDWASNYLLRESGQTDFIEDLYSDNLKKSMSSGTYDYSPEAFHLEYLAKPTEMHARIMQLRNLLGMTPEQSTMVTPEIAEDIIRKIEIPENAKFVDPKFLNAIDKDPKKLAALFNRLWAAPAATALGASQLQKKKYGGLQRSYLKTKKFK